MVKIQHFLWVESLVEELRSHMPCAVANKQKKELSLSLSLFLSLSLSRSFIKKKKEGCTATHHHGLAQFSSVAQSCPIICDPLDCSMTGFPVHHQLLELAQTHVHPVGDTIQPSHPLPAPSVCQLFTSGGQNIGVSASASVLPMNIQD